MIHGNYFDKYQSKSFVTRRLTHGFLSAWGTMAQRCKDRIQPKSLLETGCGDGYLLETIRRIVQPPEITVGLEPGIIDIHRSRGLSGHFSAVGGSIYNLPFSDSRFDLVIVPEVFEHLEDPSAGREEVFRVARKVVIASVPWEPVWRLSNIVRGSYWKSFGNTPGHLQHFSRRSFVRFMSSFVTVTDVLNPFPWIIVMGNIRK